MTRLFSNRFENIGLAALLVVALLTSACQKSGSNDPAPAKANSDENGLAALDDGDWSRAYDSFTTAIEANPQDADAYYGRAAASLARAKEYYSLAQAAATNQKIEEGQTNAAKADEFFKKATDDVDALLKIDEKYADAWFLKGVAFQYQGMWNEGIEAFTECVKLDPARGEAFHRRGEIYDHIGDYMNASVDFKKAGELGYGAAAQTAVAGADADVPEDFSDLNYDPDAVAGAEDAPAEK